MDFPCLRKVKPAVSVTRRDTHKSTLAAVAALRTVLNVINHRLLLDERSSSPLFVQLRADLFIVFSFPGFERGK